MFFPVKCLLYIVNLLIVCIIVASQNPNPPGRQYSKLYRHRHGIKDARNASRESYAIMLIEIATLTIRQNRHNRYITPRIHLTPLSSPGLCVKHQPALSIENEIGGTGSKHNYSTQNITTTYTLHSAVRRFYQATKHELQTKLKHVVLERHLILTLKCEELTMAEKRRSAEAQKFTKKGYASVCVKRYAN